MSPKLLRLLPALLKREPSTEGVTIRTVAIGSAFSRVDPSHLNDTPSHQQPVWALGQQSFSLAALIYWLSAWSSRKTSGHVSRANDAKRYGEVEGSLPSVVLLVLKRVRRVEHAQHPPSLRQLT
jgi:hypothetical protein